MQPNIRRSLDGLLAIGPHSLDAQFHAITGYAARAGRRLDTLWAILPGQDPVTAAPDSAFPLVVFDDEIAAFTADEYESTLSADAEEAQDVGVTDWHVAHAKPQVKKPTAHLPVYGATAGAEIAGDAILYIGGERLDQQIARIEAYAIRSGIRLQAVYIAQDRDRLVMLLQDFKAARKLRGTHPTLTVARSGEVEAYG